jgi:hypothetical protein
MNGRFVFLNWIIPLACFNSDQVARNITAIIFFRALVTSKMD